MDGLIVGRLSCERKLKSSGSDSSRISTKEIYNIIEKLKCLKNRDMTKQNYLGIWRQFNKFISRLDIIPRKWEERTVLFVAHLIEQGLQSATVRSYISAIKCMVKDDNYDWDDNQVLLSTLMKAC